MNTLLELEQNATQAAKLLKVMSNENRLMILCTLLEKPLSVSALNELIPLSQSPPHFERSPISNNGKRRGVCDLFFAWRFTQ